MSGREAFAARFDVPRETLARLDVYQQLLCEWQQRMNLVGPSTLPHIWDRHFTDSAQLHTLAEPGGRWLDIGAGGGLPGLILAMLDPGRHVTLVESVTKKCQFLATVASETGIEGRVAIANCRVETLPMQRFDVITARAVASLDVLFDWTLRFARPGLRWVLPKGARVEEELAVARRRFHIDASLIPSLTDPDARIVVATMVKRR